MNLETTQQQIIDAQVKAIDRALSDFFTPYFRDAGIKGEITKGKIKWRGIKIKVQQNIGSTTYQLNQRGVHISPRFEITFNYELNKSE